MLSLSLLSTRAAPPGPAMEFPDLGAHCSEPSCQRLGEGVRGGACGGRGGADITLRRGGPLPGRGEAGRDKGEAGKLLCKAWGCQGPPCAGPLLLRGRPQERVWGGMG